MEGQNREENPIEVQPPSQVEHDHENSFEVSTSSSIETNLPESSDSFAATIVSHDTETMIHDTAETLSTFSMPNG